MPLSFGLKLGDSTDGRVDDLSQTGSCTSVRTSLRKYTHSENYMPRVIKIFEERGEINGAKAHGYGLRTEAKIWFQLLNDLWFNYNAILSIR